MKHKSTIFNLLSGLFSLLMIVPMCVVNYVLVDEFFDAQIGCGLFANWTDVGDVFTLRGFKGEFNSVFAIITSVLVCVVLAVGAIKLVLTIIGLMDKKLAKKLTKLNKLLTFVLILSSVLLIASTLVFIFTNTATGEYTNKKLYMSLGVGAYLSMGFALVSSVLAVLGNKA